MIAPSAARDGEALRIVVPEADLDVSARLDRPVGPAARRSDAPPGEDAAVPLLVFGHGAGAGIDHPLIEGLAAAFVAAGIAVLRYQFPFMERRGGGGFGRDPLPVAVATVAAATACARSRCEGASLFAGGHSYGARMTTHAAAAERLHGVRGCVLLSFPLHAPRKPSMDRGAHLDAVGLPLLFLSGSRDAMAEAPLLEALVARCGAAQLLRIEGADHGWKAPRRRWTA
jgi:predicted alpha/beta-hydrolase family hydrolase